MIYFIGVGPGPADLITVKGKELIEKADVIIYNEEKINEYELSLFIREEDSDLYRKFQETHFQRAYDLKTIKELIEESGLEYITAYDAFTRNAPTETSERIYVIARERGK